MSRTVRHLLWYWGPLVAYAALVFVLSSMSHPPVPVVKLPNFDKVLHMIEYTGLGLLLCRGLAMGREGLAPGMAFLAAILLGTLYGTTDELHQMFVPMRTASLGDLCADVVGSTLGGLSYWVLFLRKVAVRRSEPHVDP
jgi:VanZ family protein